LTSWIFIFPMSYVSTLGRFATLRYWMCNRSIFRLNKTWCVNGNSTKFQLYKMVTTVKFYLFYNSLIHKKYFSPVCQHVCIFNFLELKWVAAANPESILIVPSMYRWSKSWLQCRLIHRPFQKLYHKLDLLIHFYCELFIT
jgi:hypothetical protein